MRYALQFDRPEPTTISNGSDIRALRDLLIRSDEIAIDTETTGLDIARAVTVYWSVAVNLEERFFLTADQLPYFADILADPWKAWIGSQMKYDANVLANSGAPVAGDLYCTLTMDRLLEPGQDHGLKDAYERQFSERMKSFPEVFYPKNRSGKPQKPKGKEMYEILVDRYDEEPEFVADYASMDAWAALRLYHRLREQIARIVTWAGYTLWDVFMWLEVPLTRVLYEMERRGILLDKKYLTSRLPAIESRMVEVETEINKRAGRLINLSSPQQLGAWLYDELGFDHEEMTATGKKKLDKNAYKYLLEQGCEEAGLIQEHKKLAKTKGTYIIGLLDRCDRNGYLHTTLNQHVADTGRLSSSDPNLQNQMKQGTGALNIRAAFIAGIGYVLIVGDYDQLEMYVLGHYCLHPHMMITKADGNHEAIRHIIAGQKHEEVLSCNPETGEKEKSLIAAHFKNGLPLKIAPYRGGLKPEDWLVIEHEADANPLILTEEHNLITPTGKQKAADLGVGDYLYYEAPELINDQLQLILATALGDGHFEKATRHHNFTCYQAPTNLEYQLFKESVLGPLIASSWDDKTGTCCRKARTKNLVSLTKAHDLLHEGGRTADRIVLKLDFRGLAVLYCDDGSLSHDDRCSETKGWSVQLSGGKKNNFTHRTVDLFNYWFDLDFHLSKNSRSMHLSGARAEAFFKLIRCAVPTCMERKLPPHHRGYFDQSMWDYKGKEISTSKITNIRRGDPKRDYMGTGSGSKYDLGVTSVHHNYFANGVLVSNSGDENLMHAIAIGRDIHSANVEIVFEEPYDEMVAAKKADKPDERQLYLCQKRNEVKAVGFGICYGKAAGSLARDLGYHKVVQEAHPNWDEKQVHSYATSMSQDKIDLFFEKSPGIKKFIKSTIREAYRTHYVETVIGRRRGLHNLIDWEMMLDHKLAAQKRGSKLCWCNACNASRGDERKAVNTRIQGSAADICAKAMIAVESDSELKELGYEQVLQVHDEIVGRNPDETKERSTELVQWHMEHPGLRLKVPLRAGPHWASSWAEAKG